GAVAITADRILGVGPTKELQEQYRPQRTLDARDKVVMPGLIDGHSHAGHGLVKSLGMDMGDEWSRACEVLYSQGSTEGFWHADALLTALERLKFGVTCSLTFLGGGDSVMRTDDPRYGDQHLRAVQEVGIREFLAVGPRRPPFPRPYSHWDGETRSDVMVSFEQQLETSETLIRRWHGKADGKINVCLMFPTHHPENGPLSQVELEDLRHRVGATRELSRKYGLLFTQDGHTRGTVKFAHEVLGILGPDALLSHSTELTAEEIRICRETDTRIVHNPSAITSMRGRCPATELIDAGVTVMLGSDGVGPDRSYDMFRHMFQAMRYHRFHFRDPDVLPAGQVLAMVTIDAARALGLEKDLGSLEPGKKADVILIDMLKPHLYPPDMPVYRVAYFANGNDVDTVIINGEVLMEGRRVKTVDEAHVLALARKEATEAIERSELGNLLALPEGFWGVTKGLPDDGS
ncbi:MAG: amidohydrolase family protein, partial [Deltaproteobacteria bacterium]|nr:amidohydrolase family protein [Deltaproteobacteria bacterium]